MNENDASGSGCGLDGLWSMRRAGRIEPVQSAFPVAREHALCRAAVMCAEGGDQFVVVAQRVAAVGRTPKRAVNAPHLRFEIVEHGNQLMVAAALDECCMERRVS